MRTTAQLRWTAALSLAVFAATIAAPPLARAQASITLVAVQAMSTRKKVLLLAGAAALYWLYKRHQNARGYGAEGQYYRSRNGRVYYRDARTHQAIWVTPPPTSRPIEVPADEYQRYVGQLPAGYGGGGGGNRVLTAPPRFGVR
jgi:hypothetical protein